MTKILIFSTAYFPFVGGAEVAVKEITDRLSPKASDGKHQFLFDMITARLDRKLPSKERIGNINVYRLGFGFPFLDKIILAKFGWLKALRLDKKNNYSAVWSIMASQAGIAAALFKIFKPAKKLILTLQEGDEEEHLARYVFNIKFLYKLLIRPWHRLVFKKADYITAISRSLKERARKSGAKAPIEIIPNGAVLNVECRMSNAELNEFKKKLGIKEGEKVLITTSRLVKKNAVGDIIRAMPELQITNYKLLILGTGPNEDKLKNLTEELKVEDKVLFLGEIDNKEIPKYLKISDIFIRPSLSEGLGNSFLEAMAAGVPVIGTPVGGILDFLKDGRTGLFCEPNNPKSIAEKINIYLKDDELRRRIIANAKKLVEERYNWDLITEKMRSVLRI
jgi:glycosyltransferase involved in cell wall biosynthesis